MMKIDIYARSVGYGYMAKSPDTDGAISKVCPGPKQAAVDLADKYFGKGHYSLRTVIRKVYEATGDLSK